ncbi:MAG TPA: 4Fe-4S dicluster domain-containing protein [Desulfosporosinus sp.]|nr:4Fe-4S dicluster domain-containing protein [Desulfosporosinus sp.]
MREQLIEKIRKAGVVGAGGAGFPTHVKVASNAQTVVVNGAECEPLLRVDQQLMDVLADKMVRGLESVMMTTGATEGIIALKSKYKSAIASLEKEIVGKPIRITILGDFYPAGDEHLTVYESTGRLVPQGGIPLRVDCVVSNVETLINIADAVEGKPVTDTYFTITGEVPHPLTLKLPIGTSVLEALTIAGRTNLEGMKVIEGGPMMGKIIEDLAQPITKTTKGLIVLSLNHPLIQKRILSFEKIAKQAQASCIQCRYCTDLCPRYLLGHHLEPHKIMRTIKHLQGQEETMKMALACSECGVCEQYACVMGLSPRSINTMIKRELSKMGIKPDTPPANQTANSMQKHRKIPVKRLISRLGLKNYDVSAPLSEEEYPVNQVEIKLRQHVGAPSQAIVQVGQRVQKGDLIAVIPDKALGANIHASISGVIKEITDSIVISLMEGSDK